MARIFPAALALVFAVLAANVEAGPLEVRQATGVSQEVNPSEVGSATGPAVPSPAAKTNSELADTSDSDPSATTNTSGTSAEGALCNSTLLKIVGVVASASENAKGIKPEAGAEQAMVKIADALQNTAEGVKTVAEAISQGQRPSASASQKVTQGLTDAQTALKALNSSDAAIATVLKNFQEGVVAVKELETCTPVAPPASKSALPKNRPSQETTQDTGASQGSETETQ
ncbi:hypothetical protein HGRIS_014384 [Hohenbuehelia grisea]|uniref:Uncharacterized protein n=1 Tax=Hohenbuehelia grisea TaxID=104357 RepID=A0ABR3JTF3_9AGAR